MPLVTQGEAHPGSKASGNYWSRPIARILRTAVGHRRHGNTDDARLASHRTHVCCAVARLVLVPTTAIRPTLMTPLRVDVQRCTGVAQRLREVPRNARLREHPHVKLVDCLLREVDSRREALNQKGEPRATALGQLQDQQR